MLIYAALLVAELSLRMSWANAFSIALTTFDFTKMTYIGHIQNIITCVINFVSCLVTVAFIVELYQNQLSRSTLAKGILTTQSARIITATALSIAALILNTSRDDYSMPLTHICNWLIYHTVVDDILFFVPAVVSGGNKSANAVEKKSANAMEKSRAKSSYPVRGNTLAA